MSDQRVIWLCQTCAHPAAWHTWGKGCEGHNPWHGNPAEVCACTDYDNGRPSPLAESGRNTMSRPKIVDGKVNLFLTLSAVFTNDETEPLLATNAVRVSEDHPLFAALTKVWHVSERTGAMWNDDPNDDSKVRAFRSALEHVLDVHFE